MNSGRELFSAVFLGMETWRLAALFGSILAALVMGKFGRMALVSVAGRLDGRGRPLLAVLFRAVSRVTMVLALAFGLKAGVGLLTLPDTVGALAQSILSVLLITALGALAYQAVEVVDFALHRWTERTATAMDRMVAPLVRKSLRILIVVLTLLQIATTLSDKPVTSLLAGLGVGGLAVALAAQETVKNFFGSLVIFADKPFEVGDRVVVDGFDGNVEDVGFRSTRLRTLEGHQVTLPNGELANKMIQNISRRPYIRRLVNLSLPYDTPPEKVRRALEILRELLTDHEGFRPAFPPRVYFNEFASAALNVLVMYWYHPPDYFAYLDYAERLNLEILRRFNAEGIEFAFPTQTLFLAGDPKRPLREGFRP